MHEMAGLTQSNRFKPGDIDLLLEKLRKTKSMKRRLPLDDQTYESYLAGLQRFAHDNRLLIRDLHGFEYRKVLKAVRTLRGYLTVSSSPPINEVIDLNLLPALVSCLGSGEAELEFEAAWALTNIAVGTTVQTRFLMEAGAVVELVRLLRSDSERVRVQAVWALGNVAGDLDQFRRFVVESGALEGIVHVMRAAGKDSTILRCVWALENICSGETDAWTVLQILPAIRDLLEHPKTEIVNLSMKILSSMSANRETSGELAKSGLLDDLQQFLKAPNETLPYALQIIINMTNSDGTHFKEKLIERNMLNSLFRIMNSSDIKLMRQVSEIICNITTNNTLDDDLNSQLLPVLLINAKEQNDEKIQSYTVSSIYNIISDASSPRIEYMIENGVIKHLTFLLEGKNDQIFHKTLCCLEKFLCFGERAADIKNITNQVALELMECGGLEAMEKLMSHESQDVYLKSYELIETFFKEEDNTSEIDVDKMYENFLSASA